MNYPLKLNEVKFEAGGAVWRARLMAEMLDEKDWCQYSDDNGKTWMTSGPEYAGEVKIDADFGDGWEEEFWTCEHNYGFDDDHVQNILDEGIKQFKKHGCGSDPEPY